MPVDPTATELMSIGRFSRASRLSLKALRLYAELGLLTPAHVDERSGYRYYAPAQLEHARLVSALRQLEMPLARITELLALPEGERARAVEEYWRGVEDEVGVKRQLLTGVLRRLRNEVEIMHEVKTRIVPERKLLSIEERTLADELPNVIQRSMDALIAHAREAGVEQAGPMLVVFHGIVSLDADGPVEVCMPVAGAVEPFGNARVRLEPAYEEAYARITVREVEYPAILRAYESVEAWLERNGKRCIAPPREVYFTDWDGLGPDDQACDVAFPFASA